MAGILLISTLVTFGTPALIHCAFTGIKMRHSFVGLFLKRVAAQSFNSGGSMTAKHLASTAMQAVRTGLISTAMFQLAIGSAFAQVGRDTAASHDADTTTPIKHVIVIIGENRTFDHIFATYVPVKGQTVNNLLSEGIVKADGTPGPNFPVAEQKAAYDVAPDAFMLSPSSPPRSTGTCFPPPSMADPQTLM